MPCLSSRAVSALNESIRVSNAASQLAVPFMTTTFLDSSANGSPNGSAVWTVAAGGGAAGVCAVAGGGDGAADGLATGAGVAAGADVADVAGGGVAAGVAAAGAEAAGAGVGCGVGGGVAAGACAKATPLSASAATDISAARAERNLRLRVSQRF